MSEIMQFLEKAFPPLILVFTLANLGAMGLQVKMPGVIAQLKNKKTLALIFVWGWVLRPAGSRRRQCHSGRSVRRV